MLVSLQPHLCLLWTQSSLFSQTGHTGYHCFHKPNATTEIPILVFAPPREASECVLLYWLYENNDSPIWWHMSVTP